MIEEQTQNKNALSHYIEKACRYGYVHDFLTYIKHDIALAALVYNYESKNKTCYVYPTAILKKDLYYSKNKKRWEIDTSLYRGLLHNPLGDGININDYLCCLDFSDKMMSIKNKAATLEELFINNTEQSEKIGIFHVFQFIPQRDKSQRDKLHNWPVKNPLKIICGVSEKS